MVVALGVALSSTAFAIQLMSEHRILKTPPGQRGFAILLMQDLAVIPILLLVEALADKPDSAAPAWWVSVIAIIAVLVIGKYLVNPFLRIVSRYGSAEIMTASALLIVIATAIGMYEAGLSMGMGAFIAGMLLANSSFRHQLETEIEPFKGLLLGLFFIAIGMNLDLGLLVAEPLFIVGAAILLVAIKTGVIYGLMRAAKQNNTDSFRVALMLSQGGEFAFVIMAQAGANNIVPGLVADQVTLIVGISMAMTAPLVIAHSLWFSSRNCPPVYDTEIDHDEPEVFIAGFGRFGQITGRILTANKIPFTAVDKDAEHIEFVSKFGNKVHFGDASRLDLLQTAGIAHAKILLVAVDDEEEAYKIAELVKHAYPYIKIVVRIRNRMNVARFADLGVEHMVREVYSSSLQAAEKVLVECGYSDSEADYYVQVFQHHDQNMLQRTIDTRPEDSELVERAKASRKKLEQLFQQDKVDMS